MKNKLTDKQRDFLTKVLMQKPYNGIEWTIRDILKSGWYTDYEKALLNRTNKTYICIYKYIKIKKNE